MNAAAQASLVLNVERTVTVSIYHWTISQGSLSSRQPDVLPYFGVPCCMSKSNYYAFQSMSLIPFSERHGIPNYDYWIHEAGSPLFVLLGLHFIYAVLLSLTLQGSESVLSRQEVMTKLAEHFFHRSLYRNFNVPCVLRRAQLFCFNILKCVHGQIYQFLLVHRFPSAMYIIHVRMGEVALCILTVFWKGNLLASAYSSQEKTRWESIAKEKIWSMLGEVNMCEFKKDAVYRRVSFKVLYCDTVIWTRTCISSTLLCTCISYLVITQALHWCIII